VTQRKHDVGDNDINLSTTTARNDNNDNDYNYNRLLDTSSSVESFSCFKACTK